MRAPSKKINQTLLNQIKKTLAQTLTDFKSLNDTDAFLKDFLTEGEYETFAKRLAIIYWLRKSRSYANIKENLKVSSATIASANDLINKKGVKEAVRLLEAEEWANKWSEKIKKFVK